MFKFNSKVLFFIATLTMLCFMPETSWAANGSIFDIISSKMIETVKDVRKIVYIIAGFGLIMFAVLAIFNKISFKHLSYICIGLFLLSVMMPFINYFSGANLADPELNYGMLIDPDNPNVVGSEIGDESGNKNNQNFANPGQGGSGTGNGGIPNLNPNDEIAGIPGLGGMSPEALEQLEKELGVGSYTNESTPCDGEKIVTTGGKMKCCKNGSNNSGTGCKVTVGDFVGGLKAGVTAVQDALRAGGNAKNTIEDLVGGAGDLYDALTGDGDILDRLGKLAGSLGKTADNVGSSFNNAVDSAQNVTEDLGNASRRFNGGETDFSQKVDDKDSQFNQWADKTKDTEHKFRDDLNNNVVKPGQDLGRIGDDLDGIQHSFENFF